MLFEYLDHGLALFDRGILQCPAGEASDIVMKGLFGAVPDDAAVGHCEPERADFSRLRIGYKLLALVKGAWLKAPCLEFLNHAPLLLGRAALQRPLAQCVEQKIPVSLLIHAKLRPGHADHTHERHTASYEAGDESASSVSLSS